MKRAIVRGIRGGIAAAILLAGADTGRAEGNSVYVSACAVCHATGVLGAPRLGEVKDWSARLRRGAGAMHRSALRGTAKGMPPKGGRHDLSDADIRAAVDFMLSRVSGARTAAKPAPTPSGSIPAAPAPAAPTPEVAEAAPRTAAAAAPIASPKPAAVRPGGVPADANSFNRLLRPLVLRNPPPAEDGIHDASNDATLVLQSPRDAFAGLPKSGAGNRVDWGKALAQKSIAPRWDRADAAAEPATLDLNIVREVKGSMPDVVYPHKAHTEWLDCSNCHPAIFVPQKGANQISMAAILLGEKCGACHGRVAFPVSECRLCHARKKTVPAQTSAAERAPEGGKRE